MILTKKVTIKLNRGNIPHYKQYEMFKKFKIKKSKNRLDNQKKKVKQSSNYETKSVANGHILVKQEIGGIMEVWRG